MTPKEIAELIVSTIDGKKAEDIKLLRTTDVTVLADYFVICNGASAAQIRAIAEEVELKLKNAGEMPINTEGYAASSWVLLDYGSVVVHAFRKEMREFYSIERLWSDAPRIPVDELLK